MVNTIGTMTHDDTPKEFCGGASPSALVAGAAGLLFVTYLVAYNAGITKFSAFPRVDEFSFQSLTATIAVGALGGLAIGSLWFGIRCKVRINNRELRLRNFFSEKVLPWQDVVEVVVGPNLRDITVRGHQQCLTFSYSAHSNYHTLRATLQDLWRLEQERRASRTSR